MKLPNADYAIADIRKLYDYSLNPMHRIGKHKAYRFLSELGVTANNAEKLRDILLNAVKKYEAEPGLKDAYGQRCRVDFPLEWKDRRAMTQNCLDYRT